MSQSIIRALYESRLKSWARSRMLEVAFENVTFNPKPDAIYLQAFLLPALTASDDLAGAHRVYTGVFQVNVLGLKGGGVKDAQDIAEGLAAHFTLNHILTQGAFSVQQITPAAIAVGLPDEARFSIPVSFRYRADTIS